MQNNIPKLRFKEFTDEWQEKKLGDIAEFFKGCGISKEECNQVGINECIRYGELYTHYVELIKEIKSRTNLNINKLFVSQVNDVIIPASGETNIDIATASCVLKDGVALGGDLNVIRTKHNGIFLSYYLNNTKRNDIARLAQGNSVVHLYSSQLKGLALNLPINEEQEKIAGVLMMVDEKINKLEEKKKGFEKYKKGVMQAIFSQKLRFRKPDGSNFPDWEEKKLGEIGEIIGGGTPDTSRQEYWNGPISWLTPTEVKDRYVDGSIKTISEKGLKNSSAKILPIGTIIFTSRATVGDVGISTIELTTNQGFQSIIVNKSNCNIFFYYWVKYNKKVFLRKASGSTFLEISKTEMVKIRGLFPQKTEQEKIAEFLTSLDDKVELISKELEQAKLFKKSLLQQIFV